MTYPGDLQADLVALETRVQRSLSTRDMGDLEIVGFGEFSVAIGLGDHIAKRMPTFSATEFDAYKTTVDSYIEYLRGAGVPVTPTTAAPVLRPDGRVVGYLVQPRRSKQSVGGPLLRAETPVVDHPLLTQIGQHVIAACSATMGIDAQVTNWALIDRKAELLDVGTPIWVESGKKTKMDMAPFLQMIPAPTRWIVGKAMTDLMTRFLDPAAVLVDAVAGLIREGLDDWVDVAAATWSDQLGAPVTVHAARANLKEDLRILPALKMAQRAQRRFVELRGGRYDFFIPTTYGDDRLL